MEEAVWAKISLETKIWRGCSEQSEEKSDVIIQESKKENSVAETTMNRSSFVNIDSLENKELQDRDIRFMNPLCTVLDLVLNCLFRGLFLFRNVVLLMP